MLRILRAAGIAAYAFGLLASPGAADPRQQAFSVVYAFDPTQGDGQAPHNLVADKAGNLYGVSDNAGSGDCCGAIFKLAPDGTMSVIYTFQGAPNDGINPFDVVLAKDGTMYGAAGGGSQGFGMVYKVTPDGHETVLVNFDATTGVLPMSGPIIGRDGNLYGTLAQGGACQCTRGNGVVYRIMPDGQFQTVYAFQGGLDGCHPWGGLVQDKAGMLYGASNACGAAKQGVVYKVNPTTGTETVLHAFATDLSSRDGADAVSSLILDDAGNLYGGTIFGGNDTSTCRISGCGTVFKVTPRGTFSVLYAFTNPGDGDGVSGPMYRDKKGNIFGTTRWGGAFATCSPPTGCGTVFELHPDGTKAILHVFTGNAGSSKDGAYPFGMIADPRRDGGDYVYGTTDTGPTCEDEDGSGCGMIFKIAKK